jgi:hypothetical protein
VAAKWAESQSDSLGWAAAIFFVPAYFLSMPWCRLEVPLFWLPSDVAGLEIGIYAGLVINAALLTVLALWRRPPYG